MYRIIIILILLLILFYMIRRAIHDWGSEGKALPAKDSMVQDPVCKVYVTAGSAVVERVGGQTYYFCSKECAHSFKEELSR